MENIILLEIMVATAAGAAIGLGIGLVVSTKDRKRRLDAHYEMFCRQRSGVLREIAEKTGAANVLLLKIRDGGGKLIESESWFSSVIDEFPRESKFSAKQDWQDVPVSDRYRQIVTRVRRQGKDYLHVDGDIGSVLKGVYLRRGIVLSGVVDVFSTEYYYYYMSIVFDKESAGLASDHSVANVIDINRFILQNIYHHYAGVGVMELD